MKTQLIHTDRHKNHIVNHYSDGTKDVLIKQRPKPINAPDVYMSREAIMKINQTITKAST